MLQRYWKSNQMHLMTMSTVGVLRGEAVRLLERTSLDAYKADALRVRGFAYTSLAFAFQYETY